MSFERPLGRKSENAVEEITFAAIAHGAKIFTGKTHGEAFGNLDKAHPQWESEDPRLEEGFLTSSGRFVTRAEAGKIAEKAEQLNHMYSAQKRRASEFLDSYNIEKLKPE